MSDKKVKVNVGPTIGLGGLTFLVLLILKLTGSANVTWFWVFFPLWIGPVIVLGIFAVFMLLALIVSLFK